MVPLPFLEVVLSLLLLLHLLVPPAGLGSWFRGFLSCESDHWVICKPITNGASIRLLMAHLVISLIGCSL
jgi:hypothetical protein